MPGTIGYDRIVTYARERLIDWHSAEVDNFPGQGSSCPDRSNRKAGEQMDLWIQPCRPCAALYGQPATVEPHDSLTLVGAGAVTDAKTEQRYTCTQCGAA